MTDPDPYDVSRCPRGHRCEACGVESADVAVSAVTLTLAVICLTLCPRCALSSAPPAIQVGTALRLVEQHAAHVRGGGEARPVSSGEASQ